MALPYKHAGTYTFSGGVYAAIAKQSKLLNLKPAKRVVFTFDPFAENTVAVRDVLYCLSSSRVQDTNPKCIIKSNVVCDRATPTINVTFETGKNLLFKTEKLKTLEILKLFNELVSSQYKPEETAAVEVGTKAQKKKRK